MHFKSVCVVVAKSDSLGKKPVSKTVPIWEELIHNIGPRARVGYFCMCLKLAAPAYVKVMTLPLEAGERRDEKEKPALSFNKGNEPIWRQCG